MLAPKIANIEVQISEAKTILSELKEELKNAVDEYQNLSQSQTTLES